MACCHHFPARAPADILVAIGTRVSRDEQTRIAGRPVARAQGRRLTHRERGVPPRRESADLVVAQGTGAVDHLGTAPRIGKDYLAGLEQPDTREVCVDEAASSMDGHVTHGRSDVLDLGCDSVEELGLVASCNHRLRRANQRPAQLKGAVVPLGVDDPDAG